MKINTLYLFFSKGKKVDMRLSWLPLTQKMKHFILYSNDHMSILKEPRSPYNTLFDSKKVVLSHKNTYYIDVTCGN